MPQPFNYKASDVRLTETISFIAGLGGSARYTTARDALQNWVGATPAAQQNAVSSLMHQGFHVEFIHRTSTNERTSRVRKIRRALILVRIALLGRLPAVAKSSVDQMIESQLEYQLGLDLLEYADSTLAPADVNTASGRMQLANVRNLGNFTKPFFARQDALLVHFQTTVAPGIADDLTRRIYQRALDTVGRTFWAAGANTPTNSGRFNGFAASAYGENMQINCWEGVMFCAFKEGAVTSLQLQNFYNDATNETSNDRLKRFFGMQTPFDPLTAQPGDVLTWVEPSGIMNHVALYMGLYLNEPFVLHNLSIDVAQDDVAGGTTHFQTVDGVNARYNGGVTCYANTPFWDNTGVNPQYAYVQQL